MSETNVYDGDQDGQTTTNGNTRVYTGSDADRSAETGSFLATLVNQLILDSDDDQTAYPKTQQIFDDIAVQTLGTVGILGAVLSLMFAHGLLDMEAAMTGAATMTILGAFTVFGLGLHIETH